MAQNFNSHPQGSPPKRPSNGFEDLMGSLRSPGLGGAVAPLQQGFPAPQWPMQWQQTTAQNTFPFSMPNQMSPLNQMAWNQNGHDGYVQFDQEEDDELFTIDDTEFLGQNGQQHTGANGEVSGRMMQTTHNLKQALPGDPPSLSSSSPPSLPPSQSHEGATLGASTISKSPMVSNAATTARAAELRAKLLASRSSKSRQGSPAVKANELSDAKKTQLMVVLKQHTNDDSGSNLKRQAVPPNEEIEKSELQAPDLSPARTATSLNGALEDLMSEARDAADAPKLPNSVTNGEHAEGVEQKDLRTNGDRQVPTTAHGSRLAVNKSRSSSELSEPGEIRSDAGTPKPIEQPQSISKSTESSKATQVNREKQEKLARQNEVKKAYQPLKKSKAQKQESKPAQAKPLPSSKPSTAQVPQQGRKPSFERRQSAYERTSIQEESRREQNRERARDNDRRDDDRELRRPSLSQAYPSHYDLERDVAARRQKLTDDNSRRAAEYKKSLDERQGPARPTLPVSNKVQKEPQKQEEGISRSPQELALNTQRKDSRMSDAPDDTDTLPNAPRNGEQEIDTVMLSPQALPIESNEDINDWLEITEFYDYEYREKRLRLFRKKKALDVQRAELEREEELELQERSSRTRAQSILPLGTPSRPPTINVRMPPPPIPLPLRDASKEGGIKIRNAASSAGLPASQTSSPILKRQHAEDLTEINRTVPAGKRLRLETNGPSSDEKPLTSPASMKGERDSVKGESSTLESRMSRYDSWAPPPRGRPRSRSPEYRRRSLSPRGRRHSLDYSPAPPPFRFREFSNGPRQLDERSCFNCGQPGHVQTQCTRPRRDSREWPEPRNEWPTSRGYQQWVSPNYRGKNPLAKSALPGNHSPHPRPGPDRSRYSSTGQVDEMDHTGGRPRNPGAGGQSR